MPIFRAKSLESRVKEQGFTLLETIISIAVLSLISLVSIPALKNFSNDQSLDGSISDLKNAFRLAQSRSSSNIECSNGRPSVSWVIRLNASTSPNNYQIFPYCDAGSGSITIDPVVSTAPINKTVSISSITGCPAAPPSSNINTDFVFQKRAITITCSNSSVVQNAIINLKDSVSNKTKSIIINSGGTISDQ